MRVAIGVRRVEADDIEEVLDPLPGLLARDIEVEHRARDVLRNRAPRVERVQGVLEDDLQILAVRPHLGRGEADQIGIAELDASHIGADKVENQPP